MTKSDTELRAELKKLWRELKARERFNPDDINENDVILVVKRVKTSDESITVFYGFDDHKPFCNVWAYEDSDVVWTNEGIEVCGQIVSQKYFLRKVFCNCGVNTVVKTPPKYEERSYIILFVGGRFWVTGSSRARTFDELVSEVLIKDEIVYACRMTQAAVLDGWVGGKA